MAAPRRPLVQHGGPSTTSGDPEGAALLAEAFALAADSPADTLTHGFHTWTARMHPAIAYRLIDALTPHGGRVLDPFCGGGTVPIEAMVAGRVGVGADLNPIARIVARVKADRRSEARIVAFEQALAEVAERSEDRVRARTPIRVEVPPSVLHAFEPHVLKELGGLQAEIAAVESPGDREAMTVVLSSILVKVSRREADSSDRFVGKTLRKGLATELFLRKGRELATRFRALREASADGPPPSFYECDVRELPNRLAREPAFDLVLTSPPYGGTYDYLEHHNLRYAFFGVNAGPFSRGELAARRHARDPDARARFDAETRGYLDVCARAIGPTGHVVLLVGDGFVGGELVRAIPHLASLSSSASLRVFATASEERPDTGHGPPRQEHLIWLRPAR